MAEPLTPKVENCQIGVFVADASQHAYVLAMSGKEYVCLSGRQRQVRTSAAVNPRHLTAYRLLVEQTQAI
jgi:hypothetical protein